MTSSHPQNLAIFHLSPLIRITLISLYLVLTLPLPFLAKVTDTPISPAFLWTGLGLGLMLLYGALSERVILDDKSIKVEYTRWFRLIFRKGWSLEWKDIKSLKMRTTGQGGLVYYFVNHNEDQAYLLPMRVAGFNRLVNLVTEKTGIDTKNVRPLFQPWMYLILLLFTLFLGLIDLWVIQTANQGFMG